MYLNKVILYGNLTRNPESRALPNGQTVVSLSVATNRSFKNKEGVLQEQTEYHNLVVFGRTAEVIAQYMKKGKPIYVEGRLQTRSWEKEGVKQYKTEIVVDNFQFGPLNERGFLDANDMSDQTAKPDDEVKPEDIPF